MFLSFPSTGGKSVNVSQHPDEDNTPVWSPDGKKLLFSSKRYGTTNDVMYAYLKEKDAFKTKDDWQLEEEHKALEKKSKKKSKDKKKKKKANQLVLLLTLMIFISESKDLQHQLVMSILF